MRMSVRLILFSHRLAPGTGKDLIRWKSGVMTMNVLDPEAETVLDVSEEFAFPFLRMKRYLENRLVNLFEHHKRYTAAMDCYVAPLITMSH